MNNIEEARLCLESLIESGLLSFAKKPLANPESLDYPSYTISLVEDDYAAKTPVMSNRVYQEFDIKAGNIMLVGEPGNLGKILPALRQDQKYRGGGAGVGFKDEIVDKLDELDPLAQQIGAVNFVVKTDLGKLKGYNTDGLGYAKSLEEKFTELGKALPGQKIVLLGSGGTGNAIAFMLADKGAQLVILNRDVGKAQRLAEKINAHNNFVGAQQVSFGGEEQIADEVCDAAAIVNVSTKGAMGRYENYFPLAAAKAEKPELNRVASLALMKLIPKTTILSDVVLRPDGTPFLNSAKEQGFPTLDGIPMVVYQGVEAIWLLHGEELTKKGITKKMVAEVMKRAAGY